MVVPNVPTPARRAAKHPQADEHEAGVCLATATTPSYLPGTLVTVDSFLRQHPGFAGDVAVIHDGLPERVREGTGAVFPRVRFVEVSPELKRRAARVGAAHPRLRPILSRLYKFEAYRLTGYRKVLLCDGDLLFRRPVDELFGLPGALVCCADRAFLEGRQRDAATFATLEDPPRAGPAGALERTFNDGFVLIDGSELGGRRLADLLALIAPETWRGSATHHLAQFVHNRHFAGRHTLVSSRYNFLVRHTRLIRRREGIRPLDAKVLHYNHSVKPWMAAALPGWVLGDVPVPLLRLWHDAWMDCLSTLHLRFSAIFEPAARRPARRSHAGSRFRGNDG